MFHDYQIWFCLFGNNVWSRTPHSVKARTSKEAERKIRQMFLGAFTNMSLVAVLPDQDPNNS